MNSLLRNGNENAEKYMDTQSCFYCRFCYHQALGGHLSVNQEEIKLRTTCYPDSSNNSIDITGIKLNLLSQNQPQIFSGRPERTLPLFNTETLIFSNIFTPCSHATGQANTSNLGNVNSQCVVSPNRPTPGGGVENNPNHLSTAAISSSNRSGSSSAFAAPAAAGFSTSPPFSLGINEVRQFSADVFRTLRDGFPFSFGGILQNHQSNITDPHPGSGFNQAPGLKDAVISSLPHGHCACVGQYEVGLSNKENASSSQGNKRSFLGSDPEDANVTNALKRQKINFHPTLQLEEPQKKELLLFKDAELPLSGSKVSFDAEEVVEGDQDLSLHL